MELEFNEYNFVHPPNFQNSKKHCLATRIFKITTLEDQQRCQCCDKLIGIEGTLPFYCYNSNQLLFLGPGIPLYFLSVRQSFYLLFALLLVFGIYAVFTNYFGSSCSKREQCVTSFMNSLSIINNIDNTTDMVISTYLILLCILILFVILQLIRRESSKLECKSDKYIDLPSNYSIMIRRLPDVYNEWDVEEMINNRRKDLTDYERMATNNLKIQKIILSYSLREVIEIEERNIDNFKKCLKQNVKFVPEEVLKPNKIAPLAIVTFEMECAKDYFIVQPTTWEKILIFFWSIYLPYSKYEIKGQKVSIQKAPEPDDIYWENCGISYYGNLCRRLVGKFFIFLLLILGLFVQILLKYFELKFTNTEYSQFMNIIFSVVVTIFNALLGELLEYVTKKERLETVTQESISLTATLSVLQFINSGVIVMFSSLVININTYSLDNLADNVVTIMLINMVLPHIIILIWDGYNPVKRFQQWRIQNTSKIFIQKQVNEAYEGADVKIAIRCAYVIKTIWLTMFYAIFFPIVIPISIVGILGFYHVEKYMYLKKYKVPNMISSALNREVLDLLDYSPFFLAVSTFFLYLYLNYFKLDQISEKFAIGFIGIYIGLGLSLIHIFIPTDKINSKIFKFNSEMYQCYKPSYKEVQNNFNTDYDIANPVYHQINKKKKNNKYFKAIGKLGGLFNFLTVKKETSSAGGESRLIFNAGEKEKSSDNLGFDKQFAAMIQMAETRKPLAENHGNIFESYISVTNKEKDKERKKNNQSQKQQEKGRQKQREKDKDRFCPKTEKKIRRQYMQPCKINAPKQDNMFIVNVSEVLASECVNNFSSFQAKRQQQSPSLQIPRTPKSILRDKNKSRHGGCPPKYQQNLLHPNFVSKINIEDIVPIFMGQDEDRRFGDYGSYDGDINSPKKGRFHDDTF